MDNASTSSQSSDSSPSGATLVTVLDRLTAETVEFSHLFALVESLLGQASGIRDALSSAIEVLARGRAQLQVFRSQAAEKNNTSRSRARAWRFPVAFEGYTYGILWVFPDPDHPLQQALADPVARDLAMACGCILFTLEQAALVRVLSRDLPVEPLSPLTNRQREVLQLYAQCYDDQQIADILCISPATLGKHRQRIYERLGVRHIYEALLLAHNVHLVSYLPESR